MSLDDVKDRLSGVKDGLFGMLETRRQNKLLLARSKPLRRSPVLNKIIGHRGINFHSDYMEIDGKVAQILTVIDREGADRSLPMFWMTYLIPRNLGDHVEARLIMPIDRMTDKWTSDAQTKSENVKHSQRAQALDTDSSKDAQIANSRTEDLNLISADLNAGDKYLATQLKLFINADCAILTPHKVELRLPFNCCASYDNVWAASLDATTADSLKLSMSNKTAALLTSYCIAPTYSPAGSVIPCVNKS